MKKTTSAVTPQHPKATSFATRDFPTTSVTTIYMLGYGRNVKGGRMPLPFVTASHQLKTGSLHRKRMVL